MKHFLPGFGPSEESMMDISETLDVTYCDYYFVEGCGNVVF